MSRRAFTLLEVLLAIALMMTLVGSMFGFLFDMLHSRQRAQEFGAQQRAATTLIDRLEGDLAGCIVGDSLNGSGVSGDQAHLQILTRSVFANAAELNVDDAELFGDLQLAEYRFSPDQQRLDARRAPASGSSSGSSSFLPLHDPRTAIPHLRFRYFDGGSWQDSFDSLASGRLPAAVEIAIWFRPWPEDLETQESATQNETSTAATSPATKPTAAFDDDAWAHRAERLEGSEPPPDRARVIVIPDSAAADDSGGSS